MASGEQIVLDDDGDGESEEADPLCVDEADVGGNPSLTTNPSSMSLQPPLHGLGLSHSRAQPSPELTGLALIT